MYLQTYRTHVKKSNQGKQNSRRYDKARGQEMQVNHTRRKNINSWIRSRNSKDSRKFS